jgi:conjugative transfer pilus assembly protein TraH
MSKEIRNISMVILFIINVFSFSVPALADLGDEMNKFWNSLGGSSNSNSAYMGQSTGYYTGGSIHVRAPVMQQNLMNIQPPRITAGCGGIDMFTGSFSHINMDQLIAQLKAIGANSLGYAFSLALQTTCPVCNSIMTKLQETADMINGLNINSCEAAKVLVDSIADKNTTLQESKCAMSALIHGSASDADAAKSKCKSESAKATENNRLDDEKKVTDINFVWQAMKTAGYVSSLGTEVAEAFMSTVGTVILKQGDNPKLIQPMAIDIEYTKALIDGGTIKIKKCTDTSKCLDVTDRNVTFNSSNAYKPKVKALLDSMQNKIRSGEGALTDSELALMGQTSIPILRISVNNVIGNSPINSDIISDLVARDILNSFLAEISSVIQTKLTTLSLINDNSEMIGVVLKNIDMVKDYLHKDNVEIKNRLEQTLSIIEASERFDRQLASSFSGNIKAVLDYSNSLGGGSSK